jgi:hypothetical protein
MARKPNAKQKKTPKRVLRFRIWIIPSARAGQPGVCGFCSGLRIRNERFHKLVLFRATAGFQQACRLAVPD